MDIEKQSEVGTWVHDVKVAEEQLNRVLARQPHGEDLQVDVVSYQDYVPDVAPKEATTGRRVSSLQDIRGLNAEKCWQVRVDIERVNKLK